MAKALPAQSPALLDALGALGIDVPNTARVVIDIKSGQIPMVWVQLFGDERLVTVVESLGSIDIERK